ncbi:MAG: AAA family ATPase [Rhodospirillaceae bacterium]
MELSTRHRIGRIGKPMTAENYGDRQGPFVNTGRQRTAVGGEQYGDRTGGHEYRSDLLESAASVPGQTRPEWIREDGSFNVERFWQDATEYEVARAYDFYRKNEDDCRIWEAKHPGVALRGVVSLEVPDDLDTETLDRWVKRQTEAWHASPGAKMFESAPHEIKCRTVEEDGTRRLVYIARGRGEWMATEGQLFVEGRASVDNRLSKDQVKSIAAQFRKKCNDIGLYCTTKIHWKDGNHHVHYITNMRAIENGNFSTSRFTRLDAEQERWQKGNRCWFAKIQNRMLYESGYDPDVQHLSFNERGVSGKANKHLYHSKSGYSTEPGAEKRKSPKKKNRDLWAGDAKKNPTIAVNHIEETMSVWTAADMRRQLKSAGVEEAEAQKIVDAALKSAEVQRIGADLYGVTLYTTARTMDLERRLVAAARALVARQRVPVSAAAISSAIAALPRVPTDAQADGTRAILSGAGLTLLEGAAGSGKTSTSLLAAKLAVELEHGRMIGMSSQGAAAEILGAELGIPAKTMMSHIVGWEGIDDIKIQLETCRLTEIGRRGLEKNLKKLQQYTQSNKVRAMIADSVHMLSTGALTDKHRAYLEAKLAERLKSLGFNAEDRFLVDEAGLSGTRTLTAVLEKAVEINVDVILSGDTRQHSGAEAGEAVRLLKDLGILKGNKLTEIFRQRHDIFDCLMVRDGIDLETAAKINSGLTDFERAAITTEWIDAARKAGECWQVRASTLLSQHDPAGILPHLQVGRLAWSDGRDEAVGDVATRLVSRLVDDPEKTVLAIATQNIDVLSINIAVKAALRVAGLLDRNAAGLTVNTLDREGDESETIHFQAGDRLVFLRNDNAGLAVPDDAPIQSGKGVRNGTLGTVTGYKITPSGPALIVRLDAVAGEEEKRDVLVNPEIYRNIAHGWAVTGHKSQGQTVNSVIALIDEYTRSNALYVMGTRHRETLELIIDRSTFATEDDFLRSVSRSATKAMVTDYEIRAGEQEAFDRVSAYVKAERASRELFKRIKDGSEGQPVFRHPAWGSYEAGKVQIKALAAAVCDDLDGCRRFLAMAGSSEIAVQIAAERREKIYAPASKKLLDLMNRYADAVNITRDQWNQIKEDAPGPRAYDHPEYHELDKARAARDSMAAEIAATDGFRRFTRQIGVPAVTIEGQARDHADRGAEAERIAGLTGAALALHNAAVSYADATRKVGAIYADLKDAKSPPPHPLASAYAALGQLAPELDSPDHERIIAIEARLRPAERARDRWAGEVQVAARQMPDPDAALRREGVDPDRLAGQLLDLAATQDLARWMLDQADDQAAARIIAKASREKEDGGPAPYRRAIINAGTPAPWTELRAGADRHSLRSAAPNLLQAIEKGRVWLATRANARALSAQRMTPLEHGPRTIEQKAVDEAQRVANLAAYAFAQSPAARQALRWINERRKAPAEVEGLAKAAARGRAVATVELYQAAVAAGDQSGASIAAAALIGGAEAEQTAKVTRKNEPGTKSAPSPWTQAIRRAGLNLRALSAVVEQHAVAMAPKAVRADIKRVGAWLEARRVAGEAGTPEAWATADNAARTACMSGRDAKAGLAWWNDRRQAPLEFAALQQAAGRADARITAATYAAERVCADPRQQLSPGCLAAMAKALLALDAADVLANRERVTDRAIRDAGLTWGQIKSDAAWTLDAVHPDHASAKVQEIAPASGHRPTASAASPPSVLGFEEKRQDAPAPTSSTAHAHTIRERQAFVPERATAGPLDLAALHREMVGARDAEQQFVDAARPKPAPAAAAQQLRNGDVGDEPVHGDEYDILDAIRDAQAETEPVTEAQPEPLTVVETQAEPVVVVESAAPPRTSFTFSSANGPIIVDLDKAEYAAGPYAHRYALSAAARNGIELVGVDFSGHNLSKLDLKNLRLTNCNMQGANLSNADLTGSNLAGCNLSGANLVGADFTGAQVLRSVLAQSALMIVGDPPPREDRLTQDIESAAIEYARGTPASRILTAINLTTMLIEAQDKLTDWRTATFDIDSASNDIRKTELAHVIKFAIPWTIVDANSGVRSGRNLEFNKAFRALNRGGDPVRNGVTMYDVMAQPESIKKILVTWLELEERRKRMEDMKSRVRDATADEIQEIYDMARGTEVLVSEARQSRGPLLPKILSFSHDIGSTAQAIRMATIEIGLARRINIAGLSDDFRSEIAAEAARRRPALAPHRRRGQAHDDGQVDDGQEQ